VISRLTQAARVAAGTALILVAAGAAALAFALPAAAAALCPPCYGFQHASGRTYVERGAGAAEQARLIAVVQVGRQRVERFWGELHSNPKVLVCTTDRCFRRIGGGRTRGMAVFDKVAVLSPLGSDAIVAARELSMNELNHRIGFAGVLRGAVPFWFNQGIAMYASDDLRHLASPDSGDRCLVPSPDEPLPVGVFEWNRRAQTDTALYEKAACMTSKWMALHGGPPAAVELVGKVAAGAGFSEASR
jgi:hypothetical protein